MKRYIESIFFWENHATLPGILGLFLLEIFSLISSKDEKFLGRFASLKINSGLLILKIINQTKSKMAKMKYPVMIQENIAENTEPLSKGIIGSTNKHPTNRINLTLGSSLENCSNCSDDIFQSRGIKFGSGNTFHSLFFKLYNMISKKVPTIGYSVKQSDQKMLLPVNNSKEKDKRIVITLFGPIDNSPDEAIILGLLKNL